MTEGPLRTLLIMAVCGVICWLSRIIPFALFKKRDVPGVVRYLGKVLPAAIMCVLVVYCVRDISFTAAAGWLPYTIALAVTAGLHLWKSSTALSIFGGTAVYMLLTHLVFV